MPLRRCQKGRLEANNRRKRGDPEEVTEKAKAGGSTWRGRVPPRVAEAGVPVGLAPVSWRPLASTQSSKEPDVHLQTGFVTPARENWPKPVSSSSTVFSKILKQNVRKCLMRLF